MVRRRVWWGVILAVLLAIVASWAAGREPDYASRSIPDTEVLETELEALRVRLSIPGLSAAIARDDEIIWARGFGMASVERGVPATADTIYPLASLTKGYASTVILQLAEEGRLDLDAPVARFGIDMDRSAPVLVRHLLTHTSGDPPGTRYRYDGSAFGSLTAVIEQASGRSFLTELVERIVRPLDLRATAPYPGEPAAIRSVVMSFETPAADIAAARAAFDRSGLDRPAIESALAQGYARAWGRGVWPSGLAGPHTPLAHAFPLSATAGLVASAPDVARFSMALDDGRLLSPESRERAWTPAHAPDGIPLPYGLGWFVQIIEGERVVWAYGHAFESSALLVKLPRRRLTFVALANSDGLSRRRGLGDHGDVTASPAAQLFLSWVATAAAHEPDAGAVPVQRGGSIGSGSAAVAGLRAD